MQVNPEDGPPEINVTWSDPRMTDFKNGCSLVQLTRNMQGKIEKATMQYKLQHKVKVDDKKL